MDEQLATSKSPELRHNLHSMHLKDESSSPIYDKYIETSHYFIEQREAEQAEPNSSYKQCISPLSIQTFPLNITESAGLPMNKNISDRVSLDVHRSLSKQNKQTYLQQKSQKHLRDLNNSIANLASKRIANSHTLSDNGATGYCMTEGNDYSERRLSKSPNNGRNQEFYGSRTPTSTSSNLLKFSETAKPKKSPNNYRHYQCDSTPVKFEQARQQVQKNLSNLFYTINEKTQRNEEPTDLTLEDMEFNPVQIEGSSPVQTYKGRKNMYRHINGSSVNSLNSGSNPFESRLSEFVEEFKTENFRESSSKPRKTSQHNINAQKIKNLRAPVSGSTAVLRTEPSRSIYVIYDMHDMISRHSKKYLDEKPKEEKVYTEEMKQKEELLQQASFRAISSHPSQQNENISDDEGLYECLDTEHISDGVIYGAGGVGVGRAKAQRSNKARQKPNVPKNIVGDEILKEALKIKNDMAKRKRDLEELKQFIKLASRESRYSKAGESCGNMSVSNSSAFLRQEILPTTAMSTQGNQQFGAIYEHHASRHRAVSITRRVVTCGDVSAFDADESHHKGHPHDPIQTESNQIYFQTEANTGESVYELRMEHEQTHHACCYPKKNCVIF